MRTSGDGTGEPLVGRGSARRSAAEGEGEVLHVGDDDRSPPGPSVPRPPLVPVHRAWPRSWFTLRMPNARFALGVALIVALGGAWIALGQPSSRASAPPRAGSPRDTRATRDIDPTTTTERRPTGAVARVVAVPGWVPRAIAATCHAHASAPVNVVVDCTPGRGVTRLQYRRFASVAALRIAYAAGSPPRGGTGPSACATGVTDERSWSVAASPRVPVGRYRCELVVGRARIVWSNERVTVMGIASRADADLRSLYQWWTTVPGPSATAFP
jgi:hypothetical protein